MQRLLFGVALGLVLVLATGAEQVASEPAMQAQPVPGRYSSVAGLTMHVESPAGAPHTVIVLAPKDRVMAVYHVDRTTGEIALKSVRNLAFDLELMEYNSGEPLPQSIRDMRGELQR